MEKSNSKQQHNTKDQHSPGVLNEELIGHFKTVNESITELAIDSIQPCPIIPDYLSPTESFHPIVIQTPESYRCIDGFDLINKEKAAGSSVIRCHVFKIENHSETELAIRKVSIRTKALGGTCSYPETIRNCRLLAEIIMDEKEDLVIFSHGGTRKGGCFTNNREDDLREILVERLGKSRTTINTYLNQSRYLNNDAFNALITADKGRQFFESCRVNKRLLIKNMESDGADEGQITETVSTKMLDWLDEFSRTGKIVTDFGEDDGDDGDANPVEENDGNDGDEQPAGELPVEVEELSSNEIFQHQTVVHEDDSLRSTTEEDVRAEIRTIIISLTDIVEQSPIEIDSGIDTLNDLINKLILIPQMLMDIHDHDISDDDEEAA